jgi:hypothetical protein
MGCGWLLYYDFLSWTWQLNLGNKRSLSTTLASSYSVRIQSSIVVLGWGRSTDIPWAVFPSYWRQPGCRFDDQLAVGRGLWPSRSHEGVAGAEVFPGPPLFPHVSVFEIIRPPPCCEGCRTWQLGITTQLPHDLSPTGDLPALCPESWAWSWVSCLLSISRALSPFPCYMCAGVK